MGFVSVVRGREFVLFVVFTGLNAVGRRFVFESSRIVVKFFFVFFRLCGFG